MLSAKQEQPQSKVNSRFEKYSKIGDPEGVFFIAKCLNSGTILTQSLKTLAQSEIGKKAMEVELTLLLFESMQLVTVVDNYITCNTKLTTNYSEDREEFCEWFVDEFIEYVMTNEIIDIDTITYEISTDTYLMSPSCIKRKYAGFRNMLADFGVIALRADARYTILQKLDKYIARPEVRRKVTEKQLFAQLQRKKELGNTGEEWVLDYEKRRITNPALNGKIKRISLIDVSAGFDIVSFDTNESTLFDRFIEVKTYKGNEHFHWSHNEIEKANLMGDQYFIYLVDADCLEQEDYEPKIIQDPIRKIGESEGWAKRPDSYLVEKVIEKKQGAIVPLFANVDESMPVHRPRPYEPYNPTIEITTSEITIAAKNIRQIADDSEIGMVAETMDVASLAEETRKEIFKKSLEQLFNATNGYLGDKIFKKVNHWQPVYRDAVEMGFAIENDYAGFASYIHGLHLENCPVTFNYDSLKKADIGVYLQPVEEWTLELYQTRNMRKTRKPFDEMLLVGTRFKEILTRNIPKKRKNQ